ncbi:hypothetical protein [Paracoccus seriniphilus]|uniref:Uncharacterized protein n=1 Tax=Paracoccus seriniphilus TaxID=184748 RepID=A0A239PTL0_9RHOB|nr:hypothetical protein [Paracoccus seriniphilus]WCR14264.1 hypothetical protein JHW44_02000 [Paracoccus seriniphilus]SNT73037.1 hypothetical protein SAMN05444959_104208 [Paracoccus seriniphilus]
MTDLPRLLIIGNSHIAGPRLAYVSDPENWPAWDMDFMGLLAGNMARLNLRDGILVPDSPEIAAEMKFYNLVRELDVTGYDAFVIVGGFGWVSVAAICAEHRSLDFPSVKGGDVDCQLVSRRFLQEALRRRVRNSVAARLAARLADLGKPMLMLPEPMPSADCVAAPGRFAAYLDLVGRGDALHWRNCFQDAAHAVLDARARLVFWPEEALEHDVFTRADLMRGALRLSPHSEDPQPETDFAHGNLDYGRLVLDQIMEALPAV